MLDELLEQSIILCLLTFTKSLSDIAINLTVIITHSSIDFVWNSPSKELSLPDY